MSSFSACGLQQLHHHTRQNHSLGNMDIWFGKMDAYFRHKCHDCPLNQGWAERMWRSRKLHSCSPCDESLNQSLAEQAGGSGINTSGWVGVWGGGIKKKWAALNWWGNHVWEGGGETRRECFFGWMIWLVCEGAAATHQGVAREGIFSLSFSWAAAASTAQQVRVFSHMRVSVSLHLNILFSASVRSAQ